MRSSSTITRPSVACARSGRRSGSRRAIRSLERPAERGPFRGEHTEAVLVELCGYTRRARPRAGGGRRLRRAGDSGMNETPRDLVGYGAHPPDPRWPDGKRVALNLVLNYEEGGENTPLDGDPASEAYLHEVVGAPATVGRRNLNTESMFEFGSRAGFWRVHRIVHVVRPADHGVRGRPGARAEPRRGARDGRRRLGGREPWLAVDRLRRARPGGRARAPAPLRRGDRAGVRAAARRLVHGARLGRDRRLVVERRRLPLRLGLVRRRAARTGSTSTGRTTSSSRTRSTRTTSSSCSRTGS